jgi:hypothetical protein
VYGETLDPIIVGSVTASTVGSATLCGQATRVTIEFTGKAGYFILGATATSSTGFYLPVNTLIDIYPKAGETLLSFIGTSASATTAYVLETI